MADAGTLVSTSSQYVNAYTGDVTAFDTNNTLTSTMKTYYDTLLLTNIREKAVFAQLGKKEALPAGRGRTVEWRKWNTLPDAAQLTEGVIPTGKKFGQSSMTVALTQHGIYVAVSDLLDLHAIDPVIVGATEEIGASLTRTYDKLVRNTLLTGGHVIYADAVDKTNDYAFVSSPATRTALSFDAAAFCGLSPDMIAKAVTRLEKTNTPYYEGSTYVAVAHPSVIYDLRRHPEWIDVHKYAAVEEIFNGEVGQLNGVRFIRSTLAPVIRAAGLIAAADTLTVKTAISSSTTTVAVKEAISSDEATALAGRKIFIGDSANTISSATSGTAGSATLTVGTAVTTVAANTVIYPGEAAKKGGAVYPTMFFGKDAFAVVDPDGAQVETIFKSRQQIGGPLEQFSTVGGKFETATKLIYPERMVTIECCSSYSGTDKDNITINA